MRIQKSLVYFVTALRSNQLLMMKLSRTNFLALTEEEKEFMDDLVFDYSQALEVAQQSAFHKRQQVISIYYCVHCDARNN